MATKRKLSDALPAEQIQSVFNFLSENGFTDAAKTLAKEGKLEKSKVSGKVPSLKEFFSAAPAAKKSRKEDSDSDSDSDDEMDAEKSSSDSSSESEDEKPVAKKAAAPAAKAPVKKAESDSDSSSDSSSESEDEKPVAKKVVASKPAAKKEESSSSESESSDSESEDEKPAAKKPVVAAKKAAASSSSSSSSSSSESSSESEEEEEKPVKKSAAPAKAAATPAKTPAPAAASNGEVHKIFVKGLPWVASEEDVRAFFVECGTITVCELPLDSATGRSSGTAYITFSSRPELDAALALDGQTWPDTERWLKIQEATAKPDKRFMDQTPGEKPEGCDTVFVGNLPWDITEEMMREVFGAVGEVSSVRFAMNEDGSMRGFGHVSFYNGDDTIEAVKLAGTMMNGRGIRVDFAPPRERKSFGGDAGGRGGRGGRGGGPGSPGRGGRGGFGGGRGRGGPTTPSFGAKNKGVAVEGAGKKTTFD